jgi:prophage tail gpP-like protein
MPNPQQIATVVAGGQKYSAWESISIDRRYNDVISHMRLRVAELTNKPGQGWSTLQLMPYTPAQGYLAGQLAITGEVSVRQAGYNKDDHRVEIVVSSNTAALNASTVDGSPGQYMGYTWLQLARAIAGKVGVTVEMLSGTDKIFPRVSETVGETRFTAIERWSRMHNLYLRDDENGNLIATCGVGRNVATLVEGQNIKAANIIFSNYEYTNPIKTIGANIGGSSTGVFGDEARNVSATVTSPNMPANRPQTVAAEEPGDQIDMQMRAARQAAWALSQFIQGTITVVGWQLDDGSLWINHCGDLVTIISPMLAPLPSLTLAINGAISSQDNENGTQTLIEVCDPGSLGSLNKGQSIGTVPAPAELFNTGGGISFPSGSLG